MILLSKKNNNYRSRGWALAAATIRIECASVVYFHMLSVCPIDYEQRGDIGAAASMCLLDPGR